VTNQGDCTWYEFARTLVSAAGLADVNISPVTTAQFPRPARRPKYSVLSTTNLELLGIKMRTWRDTLPLYEGERQSHAASSKSVVS
jgi:dTDP-4-dehydrorhamnose reductase